MSPKAPILAIFLSCVSSLAGVVIISNQPEWQFQNSLEPIVPWRGIKNSVYTPESRLGIYEEILPPSIGCGVIVGFEPFGLNIPFRTPTGSLTNANPHLAKALWESERPDAGPKNQNKAIVRGVIGKAIVVDSGNQKSPRNGQSLSSGAKIITRPSARVDLFLGHNGPAIVVQGDTELDITRLTLDDAGTEKIIDTRLDLRAGHLSGAVKKLAAESTYMLRTRSNLIRIRGTEYEIAADGSCAIISGFAEVITPTQIITVNAGEKYEPTQTSLTNR